MATTEPVGPKSSLVRAAALAVANFYRGAKGQPPLAAKLLRPLFARLSIEAQLWLAREVTIGMTAACLEAKERWGEGGKVVVDGNEVRVGIRVGDGLKVLGRGRSWSEAFEDAARRMRVN